MAIPSRRSLTLLCLSLRGLPWTGLIWICVSCALVPALPELTFAWSGQVVGVADGDTISVMHRGKAEKVRLYGVDCPEHGQDYANRSKRFTSDMVYGKVVEVRQVDLDRYGRTVGWVSIDGKSLNKELLKNGLAWWYARYAPNERELSLLEAEARQKKIGIWSHPHPIPPWDFRGTTHRTPNLPGRVPTFVSPRLEGPQQNWLVNPHEPVYDDDAIMTWKRNGGKP
jgi:micrococcal nuclease